MKNQQSIAGGSLINESQKSASTNWEINETQGKSKTTRNVYLFLEKKVLCVCLGLLTWRCQGISQAISFTHVPAVEKSTEALMQASLWAHRKWEQKRMEPQCLQLFQ